MEEKRKAQNCHFFVLNKLKLKKERKKKLDGWADRRNKQNIRIREKRGDGLTVLPLKKMLMLRYRVSSVPSLGLSLFWLLFCLFPLRYSVRYPDTESHFAWPPLRIPPHLFLAGDGDPPVSCRSRDHNTHSQRNSFFPFDSFFFSLSAANLLIITEKIQSAATE